MRAAGEEVAAVAVVRGAAAQRRTTHDRTGVGDHGHRAARDLQLDGQRHLPSNAVVAAAVAEEEGFAWTTRSVAWELIPLRCFEPARVVRPN